MLKLLFYLSLAITAVWSNPKDEATLTPVNEIFQPEGNFAPDKYWKVAAIQWSSKQPAKVDWSKSKIDQNLQNNRLELEKRIRIAAHNGAKFIVLPEFAVTSYPDLPESGDNYRNRKDIENFIETIPGPSTNFFSKIAKELRIWIQVGFAEVEVKTNLYYNAAVVINDQGQIAATYRKQNLFGNESDFLEAGTSPSFFMSPIGKMGIIVCADSYDFKVLSQYKNAKVQGLGLSVAWTENNTAMNYYGRAAAFVKSYIVAANQEYYPDSGVLYPSGSTQSHIRQTSDSIAYGFIPLQSKKSKSL